MPESRLWRPFDDDCIVNPYPMYQQLRTEDPVHSAQTREIIVTGYDNVKNILKNDAFQTGNRLEWLKRGIDYLQKKDEDLSAIYKAVNSFVLMLNPPQHTRIRTFIAKAWTDRDVDQIIQTSIDNAIAQIHRKQFDVMADFAEPLSVFTISNILGIDGSEHQRLKELASQMTKAVDLYPSLRDLVQLNDAAQSFIVFFQDYVSGGLKRSTHGLLGKMIEKNKSEEIQLTDEELISVAIFLFIAGQETSSALIGNAIHLLLTHPEQSAKLKTNPPELVNSAIEETLRFDSPVQLLGRIATSDVVIGNRTINKGSSVTLVIGSANRDELIFERPDEFDISRKPNRHLSFGSGIHFCLGDWLGRRQAQMAVGNFFKHFSKAQLSEQKITWNGNIAVRSLQHLQVIAE